MWVLVEGEEFAEEKDGGGRKGFCRWEKAKV